MTRTLLSAASAFALVAVVMTSGAQAQCWWDGFTTTCAMAPVEPYYWGTPYPAFNAYDFQDYRYRPYWLPSFPGPRPGGR